MKNDITPEELKELLDEKGMKQKDLADILSITQQMVSKIFSGLRAISSAEQKLLRLYFYGEIPFDILQPKEELGNTLDFSPEEWNVVDLIAKRNGYTCGTQWITARIRDYLAFAQKEVTFPPVQSPVGNITPISTAPKKAHIAVAAGAGIEAELIDFDGSEREINVRLSGLSATPLFQDDEVVTMAPRTIARNSDHMAKGKLYLIRHEGTLKFKRYNSRPARPDEADAPYLTATGSVGLLESINPDFQTIDITTPDTNWIAWLEKDGSFPKDL